MSQVAAPDVSTALDVHGPKTLSIYEQIMFAQSMNILNSCVVYNQFRITGSPRSRYSVGIVSDCHIQVQSRDI